jgi:predicted nucleotidyltransferase
MKSNDEILKDLVESARNDPNVIGFFLSGSRGKNKETKFSDYDIQVIIKNKVAKKYKERYAKKNEPLFDFAVSSISEFRKHAEVGSPSEWARYSYTHIKVIIDKTGEIQRLVNQKGKLPKNLINKYVSGHLDGYINYVYRSLKCFRDKEKVGARLEAARSINYFLNVIFGLEGKVTPYYKYLEWELETYPLKKFPIKSRELIKSLLKIIQNGDLKTQQKLFKLTEKNSRKAGFGHVFDSWDDEAIKLIKTYK